MAKKTKYRKPDLENLRLQLGYSGLAPKAGGPGSEDKQLVEKYEDRFVRDGLTQDGKKIRIDERTGKPYNPSDAKRYINLNKYGTETPDEDFAYLNRKDVLDRKEKTGPMGIRRFFSERGTGGSKFVDLEHAAYLKKEREELEQLKKQTSFAIDGDLVRQAEMYGGDESGMDMQSGELLSAAEIEYEKNPFSLESLQAKGIVGGGNEVAMQGDRTIFLRNAKAERDRQRAKEDLEFNNQIHALTAVDQGSGGDNDTSYQASLNKEDNNIVDFENTGTEKHWKDMSQWERLQAKVKARGNPLETAKLKMQQSTFGTPSKVTQWYDLEGEDGGAAAKAEWKKKNQPEQQNVSNDTSNDGKGGKVFTPAGESASDDDKNDLFGKSIIGT